MAKKQELIARVRYIKGKPEAERTGKWNDEEQFAIEVYDAEYKEWSLDSAYPLVHAQEYPDQTEANFLRFSMVQRIIELISWGYKFLPKVAA